MKKLLAILLAVLCAFSTLAVTACAIDEDALGGIIEDQLGVTQEKDEAAAIEYGIFYEMATLSTVTVLYKPTINFAFDAPVDTTVTTDTPIAVDHNFVCWMDKKTGDLYYPGDNIHVEDKVVLWAVWEEKTDNYPGFIRSAIAGLQALLRLFENAFNFFDIINKTETTTAVAESTTQQA